MILNEYGKFEPESGDRFTYYGDTLEAVLYETGKMTVSIDACNQCELYNRKVLTCSLPSVACIGLERLDHNHVFFIKK